MPAAQRKGDANDAGGIITDIPQSTVFVNGQLVAVDGSIGTEHDTNEGEHAQGVWQTANGNSTVTANGIPINATGDADTCNHVRIGGSGNVNIG